MFIADFEQARATGPVCSQPDRIYGTNGTSSRDKRVESGRQEGKRI